MGSFSEKDSDASDWQMASAKPTWVAGPGKMSACPARLVRHDGGVLADGAGMFSFLGMVNT